MPFAVERGGNLFCIGAVPAVHKHCWFLMYGCADPSVLTTGLFSYLELLGGFSSLTLQPLGSGEGVLDVSFLKVVGIIPRFSQHLHPRLLIQAQGLDVLPDPHLWDFIPLLSLRVQPGAKKMIRLVSVFPFLWHVHLLLEEKLDFHRCSTLSYLFRGASIYLSVFKSSKISVGRSGALKSALSIVGVLKPLHQPAPDSFFLNRAVYTTVSLGVAPSPEGPSGHAGRSIGTSNTSGSRTCGCGLSVGGSGDTGDCRRDSGTFRPLERGLGYLQLGRAARGSCGGSSTTSPASWGPPGESCSKGASCVTDSRWWKGIMAGLLDCLSAFSTFSLVLCLGREVGWNVWLALSWGLVEGVDVRFSFWCFNLWKQRSSTTF